MILVLTLLLACGEKEAAQETGLCAEAPVVTWDNFGAGFVTRECQSCHASDSPNRQGAPAGVVFDTEEDVRALADRVLDRATGEAPTMPPGGGVQDEDRLKLEIWLLCE